MVTVFEEQCSAVSGGWTAMRYHGDEGDRVADMLSFKSVFEINPFEVGCAQQFASFVGSRIT